MNKFYRRVVVFWRFLLRAANGLEVTLTSGPFVCVFYKCNHCVDEFSLWGNDFCFLLKEDFNMYHVLKRNCVKLGYMFTFSSKQGFQLLQILLNFDH